MKNIKYILYFIGLTLLFLSIRDCNRTSGRIIEEVVTTYDTVWHDTTIVKHIDSIVPIYKIYPKDSIVYLYLHREDSAIYKMLREYLAHTMYNDSIFIDSTLSLRIIEDVHKNIIQSRSIVAYKNFPTIIQTNTIDNKFKSSMYIGAEIRGSMDFLDVAPTIWYTPTEKLLIGASYGLQSKSIGLSIGYKLY